MNSDHVDDLRLNRIVDDTDDRCRTVHFRRRIETIDEISGYPVGTHCCATGSNRAGHADTAQLCNTAVWRQTFHDGQITATCNWSLLPISPPACCLAASGAYRRLKFKYLNVKII